MPPQTQISPAPRGTTKTYLFITESLPEGTKDLQLALAHCLLPWHWPSQGQDDPLSCPLMLMGATWNCLEKRIIFYYLEKALNTLCLPILSLKSLRGYLCWDRWSPASSVFCGSALLLFNFWQTGTTWAPLLFWSGPAFFSSGLLVCFLGNYCLPHPPNGIFHKYLPCQFLNIVFMFCM